MSCNDTFNKGTGLEIAVIGMAARFPGADTVTAFWANIRDGIETIERLSDEALMEAGVKRELINNPRYVKAGGMCRVLRILTPRFSIISHERRS
jgi:acyl transferase domain-containing protein